MKNRSYAGTPDWFAGSGEIRAAPRTGVRRSEAAGAQLAEVGRPSYCAEVTVYKAVGKLLRFERGLYAISVAGGGAPGNSERDRALPLVQISNPPSEELGIVELATTTGDCGFWLGPEGGTVVIKVPLGGGHVLVTTYESPARPNPPLEIEVHRLDRVAPEPLPAANRAPAAAVARTHRVQLEIALHIERIGDQRLRSDSWAGSLGKRLRLEAFGIRPLQELAPHDIEYKAFGPNAEETPWVTNGQLSGTRRRGLPLTGFAVRLAPHLQDRYDVEYQGAFFDSGVSDWVRNGAACIGTIPRDPLEAINIHVTEREEC